MLTSEAGPPVRQHAGATRLVHLEDVEHRRDGRTIVRARMANGSFALLDLREHPPESAIFASLPARDRARLWEATAPARAG